MLRRFLLAFLFLALAVPVAEAAVPVELRGSPVSMQRQHALALNGELTFARSLADIDRMVDEGFLVRLPGNEYYDLREGLSSDAALPEVKVFVERLAAEYFEATGEKLVVTSLTRPANGQPSNAHALSVHPTGMALDLRVSQRAESRQWLEQRLLRKEADGLLDVTREHHPPHYHIALFPNAYREHLENELGADALIALLAGEDVSEEAGTDLQEVEEGDARPAPRRTLWRVIASVLAFAS